MGIARIFSLSSTIWRSMVTNVIASQAFPMTRRELGERSASFAKNLARARHASGMTQEQVAAGAGVSVRYYQDCEAGLKRPSLLIVGAMGHTLQCSFDDLFRGVGVVATSLTPRKRAPRPGIVMTLGEQKSAGPQHRGNTR